MWEEVTVSRLCSGACARRGSAADRDDRRPGPDRAGRGARLDPVGGVAQRPHRRRLEQLDAAGPQAIAQAQRQPRRLHRGRGRVEGAGAEGG